MTLAERYLSGIGPGGVAYQRVFTDSAVGASPLTVDTTGVADGDVCVWCMTTTNSTPDALGPEGGGWTQLWQFDLGGTDFASAWFKFAGAGEPATWTWGHSAGTSVSSAMGIWRGPARLVTKNWQLGRHWFPPAAPGSYMGLAVLMANFHASGTPAMTVPTADAESFSLNTYAGLLDMPVVDPIMTDRVVTEDNAAVSILLGVAVFE